jgi:hypothetical protein
MSIKDMDLTVPADADEIKDGALRIREVKSAVQTSFPNVDVAVVATSVQMNNTFDHGGWIIGMVIDYAPPTGWDGVILPTGFAFCDGETVNSYNTPDLRGATIIGYDNPTLSHSVDPDYDTLGNTGGAKTKNVPLKNHVHTASANSVGDHTHTTRIDGRDTNVNGTSVPYNAGSQFGQTETSANKTLGAGGHGHTITVDSAGDGVTPTLDVRQPYVVLVKLVYVGPTVLA